MGRVGRSPKKTRLTKCPGQGKPLIHASLAKGYQKKRSEQSSLSLEHRAHVANSLGHHLLCMCHVERRLRRRSHQKIFTSRGSFLFEMVRYQADRKLPELRSMGHPIPICQSLTQSVKNRPRSARGLRVLEIGGLTVSCETLDAKCLTNTE